MNPMEKRCARWFADKIASESKHTKELLSQISELGFEPSTGSIIVSIMEADGDGKLHTMKYRFKPELLEHTEKYPLE